MFCFFYLSASDPFRVLISISPAPNVLYGVGREYVLPCSNGKIFLLLSSSSARIRISLSLSYDGNRLTSGRIPRNVMLRCLLSDNDAAFIDFFPLSQPKHDRNQNVPEKSFLLCVPLRTLRFLYTAYHESARNKLIPRTPSSSFGARKTSTP